MVKCKAALALEAIAITTPGKFACIKAGAIPNLVPLISEGVSETRVNALKVSLFELHNIVLMTSRRSLQSYSTTAFILIDSNIW